MTVANSDNLSGDSRSRAVPAHIAVIMDGNGRWAKSRSLPRHAGHRSGVKSVRQTVEAAANRGVSYLTLFAFSSENWRRPAEEVSRLMGLFIEALQREVDDLHRNNVRVTFIGARDQLQDDLVGKIESAEQKTKDNDGLQLTVAVAYGGRWDIVNAAKKVVAKIDRSEVSADELDDEIFAAELALGDKPDPDLLIRTGGERRISNFLLWNLAYAEIYFCDALWPDFREQDFDDALEFYTSRQRRYGFTGDQVA